VGSLDFQINANQEQMDANLKDIIAEMKAWWKDTAACQEVTESKEPALEETESELEHQVVPKEQAAVETVEHWRTGMGTSI
jgi:cell fate (sporulation/competence/biofilm development) regulator YmcA (YheA/YmcA/DUF963 family)